MDCNYLLLAGVRLDNLMLYNVRGMTINSEMEICKWK